MKVKLLSGLAGERSWSPGEEFECDQAEAIRLIEAGHAVPLADHPLERAVKAPAPEKRAKAAKRTAEPKA